MIPAARDTAARLVGEKLPPPRHGDLVEALAAAAEGGEGLSFLDAREAGRALPWREVFRRARRVAAGLARLGIAPGERVAIVLPTSPDFPDAFFGALLAGAVPVPLYPPLRLGRIAEYQRRTARMLAACGATLVLSDARIRRFLGEALDGAAPPLGCRLVAELAADGGIARAPRSSDLALIQFSSGTTLDPRPVALDHAAIVANLAAMDTQLPENPGGERQRGVSWLPLYHDMGLIGCLLLAAFHPGSLTLIPPEVFLARPAIWLRAIARTRATVSPAPNFAYALAAQRVRDEELEGIDLSSWRLALNGAEPIAASVLRAFAARFAPCGFDPAALRPVYGLSEAALAVSFSPAGRPFVSTSLAGREVVSVGAPLPGVAIEIRGPGGEVLREGEEGRIFVRGPSLMRGYFGRPEETERALREGWLDTGDLGFVQAGELYASGRARDVLVLRGANHPPQFFEDALAGVEGVRPGCAVAVGWLPPDGAGEELVLLVEVRGEGAGLEERVRAAVVGATGIRPHAVVPLAPGTLPRTSSGKLRRAEALRRWQAGTLLPPRRVTPLFLASALARSCLAHARLQLRRRR